MFTGVIKLAQIDDYISPSQNCIQPQIMKNDNQKQKATVSLNDCLACSGCITSAESILIQQMSINKFLSMVSAKSNCQCTEQNQELQQNNGEKQLFILMSAQALLSLSKKYNISPDCFMNLFEIFLERTFHSKFRIFDLFYATQLCHELIFQQFTQHLAKNDNKPILCSQCPGWVCYAQKTLTDQVTNQMSQIKSPQQIMGRMIKQKYGKSCYVISIMPCYDKKLQAIRFSIQENIKEVDLTLASIQIVDLINKYCGTHADFNQLLKDDKLIHSLKQKKYHFQTLSPTISPCIQFHDDQVSNGYIDIILKKMGISQYSMKDIRNSDYKQYSFTYKQQQMKVAKCYGFRNIQKIVQSVKRNKCIYKYVQIMACPGGCLSGGGQVRYQDIKNKQITEQFVHTMREYSSGTMDEYSSDKQRKAEKLSQMVLVQEQAKQLLCNHKNRIQTNYKPIQKSLEQSIMNW